MPHQYDVCVLGASYGLLFAAKVLAAGHRVRVICTAPEADLINRDGIRVRIPVGPDNTLVTIDSRELRGALSAEVPDHASPDGADLVVLAMMEPAYGAPALRALLSAMAKARIPLLSVMNMPPLPYLTRLGGIDLNACRRAYTDATVWDAFDPELVTMCSPDPQAMRPPDEPLNVLKVGLATNFKVAAYPSAAHTAMLRDLERGIEDARFAVNGSETALPVKLRVHASRFVPLAKWPMLIAGNYQCIGPAGLRSIRESVHEDLDASRALYEWVTGVCGAIGASETDLVAFDRYAAAAESLRNPSAAARALYGGATDLERVDRLVREVAAQHGFRSEPLDQLVERIDAHLERNRRARGR